MYVKLTELLGELHRDERGLNTAELLGNAALAVVALVAIWAALRTLGLDVIDWVGSQIFGAG